MAPKQTKRQKAATGEANGTAKKKMKRVVIDSDEGEEAEMEKSPQVRSARDEGTTTTLEEGDEVVSEVDVFVLPTETGVSASGSEVSINRLQFPQQHPYMLRRRFNHNNTSSHGDDDDDQSNNKCFVHYKAQVKHLRLGFGSDGEVDVQPATTERCSNGAFGMSGIGELLNRVQQPSTALPTHTFSSQTATTASVHSSKSRPKETYMGEGFSQLNGLLNHAVGFFSGGRLFLLPVDRTYEMRKPLDGATEREAARVAQKAPSIVGATQKLGVPAPQPPVGPLRIRFGRPENELQRRRREQSSFFKQKLVEQDPWIPLRVEQKKLSEVYGKVINHPLSTGPSSSTDESRQNSAHR